VASNGRERWTPALNSPVLPERRTKSGTKKGSQKLIGRLDRPHQRLFQHYRPASDITASQKKAMLLRSSSGAQRQMNSILAEVKLVSDTPVRLTMSDAYTLRLAVEV
jgi:hypothetical protein